MKQFARFSTLLSQARAPPKALETQARHLCALCDGEAGCAVTAARFLKEGLQRKQTCLLVGPKGFHDATLAELERGRSKRPAPGEVLLIGGQKSHSALLEALQRIFQEAKTSGRMVRAVGNVAGYGKTDFRALMEYEPRVDALLRRFGVQAICEYDVRRFKGPELLRALKAHPDTSRYPLMMG
jgi:hypothetical protein